MSELNPPRHLYYDQQIPLEEPEDPAHSIVTSIHFAAHPPSQEDGYFIAQERERRVSAPTRVTAAATPTEPSGLWRRIYRILGGRADTAWRP